MEAFGTLADPYLSKLINDMFTAGLSKDIFHCLHTITASVLSRPVPAEWRCKSTFIGSIALLAGTPNAAGICDPRSKCRVVGLPEKIVSSSDRQEYTSKVILSLRTLGTFGDRDGMASIEGIRLPILLFVRDVAMHYPLTCCTRHVRFGEQRRSLVVL